VKPERPFERILVPVDLSPVSDELVRIAGDIALKYGSEVILLHVIEEYIVDHVAAGFDPNKIISKLEEYARKKLSEYVNMLSDAGVAARMYDDIPVGVPSSVIAYVAKKEMVTEIVMTHKGRGYNRYLAIGGTTRGVIKLAEQPVLVYKVVREGDKYKILGDSDFAKRIVFAVDEMVNDEMIDYLVRLARVSNTEAIYVVHVMELDVDESRARSLVERVAAKIRDQVESEVYAIILTGKPGRVVARFAKEPNATSIMAGRTVKRTIIERILGSTLDRILVEATVPVLVYPLHREEEE